VFSLSAQGLAFFKRGMGTNLPFTLTKEPGFGGAFAAATAVASGFGFF
jgi:hypothetical protein